MAQIEKGGFPRGLRFMIAQILIILILNDGRELPKCISWVFAKERGLLLSDEAFGCHHAFPTL